MEILRRRGLTSYYIKKLKDRFFQYDGSYDPERIEKFLEELHSHLALESLLLESCPPNRSNVRKCMKKVVASLNKTIKEIEKMYLEASPSRKAHQKPITSEDDQSKILTNKNKQERWGEYVKNMLLTTRDWGSLYKIKDQLEQQLSETKPGRPPDILKKKKLTYKIGESYKRLIEMPTNTRKAPFYQVIQLSFEILGWEKEAPWKPVRAAIKRLRAES